MALMATLSFYSVPTLKPQSSSLSHSSNKSITTLCSSRSILQAGLVKFDSTRRSRHLSIRFQRPTARSAVIAAAMKNEPLKVMISGAPASGKGTHCELITKKRQTIKCVRCNNGILMIVHHPRSELVIKCFYRGFSDSDFMPLFTGLKVDDVVLYRTTSVEESEPKFLNEKEPIAKVFAYVEQEVDF